MLLIKISMFNVQKHTDTCKCYFLNIGDEHILMKAIRCLSLLLIPSKAKSSEGDIPFLMKFVPVSNNMYDHHKILMYRMTHHLRKLQNLLTASLTSLFLDMMNMINTLLPLRGDYIWNAPTLQWQCF